MTSTPARADRMTAEDFFAWAEIWGEGERYELVNGLAYRLQSETISHAETKLAVVIALGDAIRMAGVECRAFPEGVSVRVSDRSVREPDALVHCGPYDSDKMFAPNPVVVVEVISPSSVKTDVDRKLIDYFSVPSILHYLIVYGDDGRVVHHFRSAAGAAIETRILGRDAVLDLSPPGLRVAAADFFVDPGPGSVPAP
ncbi:Uma2 family endonuclease [Aureimonas glaciei]|uniref:Putative restriction endonuclease domain-containing protein n=1 Tax=Aureimonas glaciei TaxID=1776957 RepID=A0A916Y1A3_9HYPH|nr:Uma2 family endonuclease [Aureimonas glaciei]GGD25872.1 hypothetical protein GCM10011335_31080 [Aureimonas glaciei]